MGSEEGKSGSGQGGSGSGGRQAPRQTNAEQGGLPNLLFMFIAGLFGGLGLDDDVRNNRNFQEDMESFMEPEELVRNRVFIESVQNEQIRQELINNTDISTARASEIVNMAENREAAVRAAVSRGFELYTEDGENRGVRYGFGVKNGIRAVDCSGAVSLALRNASGVTENTCGSSFSNAVLNRMATSSEEQIAAAERAGGTVLTNNQINLNSLKAGMIIGLDTGRTSFDAGRQRGIDHIVMVYRDSESGELMVGQSSSGEGVHAMKASDWLEQNQRHKLYAVDMVPLAQTQQSPGMNLTSGRAFTFQSP